MKLKFPFKNSPLHTAAAIAAALVISFLLIFLCNLISEPREKAENPPVSSDAADTASQESEVAE